MQLKLSPSELVSLTTALKRAGDKEIGGQLFGEQIEPSHFRVSTMTIQTKVGTFSRFFVDLLQAVRDAARFFDRTRHQYNRYNYIGEWHSHPSFEVLPSGVDIQSMRDLVRDPDFKGSFAVLMIVRLRADKLEAGAWLFDPRGFERNVKLETDA
ncbi:Mov34/MPN/PAD-1 family protein [Ensifer adhaerens]|uniref:Mov34/MPN/PAD-1 family protein n=1 Tax=Ensifer adhaerens TaxID=106592 RepID=A0A9Q8YJJ1_ENSAD|nr:Mov34/MPN/PAD-1 family protein [Ensifer adhaerens]USJ28604.1 Mov34/MPN/PAD-1 family protein [Ensifer adhaerens]